MTTSSSVWPRSLSAAAPDDAPADRTREPSARPGSTCRVVVADDCSEDRAEVRRQLRRGSERRYEFVETDTAEATVRAVLDAPAGPPDCLVLDYHLPDGDALEVLAALAVPGGGCVCPVVVLTGDDGSTTGRAVLRAGAQDFLGKGWMTAQSVTRALENATERYRMTQELRDREAALRRSEQALKDADRRKDEFLATLAHELRNPLAPLRTGLEILRRYRGEPRDPAIEHAQRMMERQLGHLVRLVDDLLDVSRISRGQVELRPERVRVETVLAHAVELSRPLLDAARHTLAIEAPAASVWIDGDLTRLAQVVGNLLNNAAKYTLPGGHIRLCGGVEGGEAVIRVSDDGIGIAPEMLPHVFDLFAQVDRTLHRTQGGLGIGLSLVRQLVALHGGTIAVESPGLGRGSTFTVRLPLAPVTTAATAASARTPSRPEPAASSSSHRRVLVVDDNVDGAETLATLLELSGHEATTASSGPAALEVARAWHPELVFLDIGLPGMDGYEVARRLRTDPATAGLVLVALTGWGSEEVERRSKDAGFDLHLIKPVGPEVVADVLARVPTTHGRGAERAAPPA